MTAMQLCDLLGNVREDLIEEAHAPRRRNWLPSAMAACLVLALLTGGWLLHWNLVDQIRVNTDFHFVWASVPYSPYEHWSGSDTTSPENAMEMFTGVSYNSLVARIPEGWVLSSYEVMTGPDLHSEDKETMYPSDFCFYLRSGETQAHIHLGTNQRIDYCTGISPNRETHMYSRINGVQVSIFDWNGDEDPSNRYTARYFIGDIAYDVCVIDGTLEDLVALLNALI